MKRLFLIAIICAPVPFAASAQTITAQQKKAAIDAAHASNQRQVADDAAFNAHRKRLEADLAAAKKSGNKAQVAKLEAMQQQDDTHLTRTHQQDTQQQQHIKRLESEKVRSK